MNCRQAGSNPHERVVPPRRLTGRRGSEESVARDPSKVDDTLGVIYLRLHCLRLSGTWSRQGSRVVERKFTEQRFAA